MVEHEPRGSKKTPPTTVRLRPDAHLFVKKAAKKHRNGQSGVINDAVEFYMSNRPAK